MYFIYINTLQYYLCGSLKERVYRQRHSRRKPVSQSQGPNRIFLRKAAGCQKTYRILLLRVSQEQRRRIFYDEKEMGILLEADSDKYIMQKELFILEQNFDKCIFVKRYLFGILINVYCKKGYYLRVNLHEYLYRKRRRFI